MLRRTLLVLILTVATAASSFSGIIPHKKKKNANPLANVDSKQPDKALFDRAEDAIKHGKYDTARITLQTLINTYPDSEYVARAKLSIADAWYAEGGSTALAQAEIEYKDFITFFPNMPEAAEAQLKVANIHYRQMTKPDRDYTHALRAEEEYRQLLLQFPDSKLVPQAKQHLREVQEVLAEREYRVAHFYEVRDSWPAAIARFITLVNTYPLYSKADESLYLLGYSFEKEAEGVRQERASEAGKARMIKYLTDRAAEAYARIITRYPATDRVDDAKHRLQALGRPVPTPTAEAIAQSKAEEASRSETGHIGRMLGNFRTAPDVAMAAKVGEPTLDVPAETSAVDVIRQADNVAHEVPTGAGNNVIVLETVKAGELPKNEPPPGSALSATPAGDTNNSGIPDLTATPNSQPAPTPNADSSATMPADGTPSPAAQAPVQVNDAQAAPSDAATQDASQTGKDDSQQTSSSAKKKKKGLRKLIPF
jgi:outer membrane protein assembly factor BamD